MAATDLLTDARNAALVLWDPARTFAALVARPRVAVVMALSIAAALLTAAVTLPRTDFGDGLDAVQAAQKGGGAASAEPTDYEREQAREKQAKLGALGTWTGALARPTLGVAAVTLALLLAFWVAGAPVPFRPALAVVAHAALPLALRDLLAIPAALVHGSFPAADAGALLPSSAAALLPAATGAPVHAALGALDLFTLWTLALTALGMARLSGASRTRAALATALPWAALVALTMALAAASAAPAMH